MTIDNTNVLGTCVHPFDWRNDAKPSVYDDGALSMANHMFQFHAVTQNKPMYKNNLTGRPVGNVAKFLENLNELAKELKIDAVYDNHDEHKKTPIVRSFSNPNTFVQFSNGLFGASTDAVEIDVLSFDKETYDQIVKFCKANIKKDKEVGTVYVMVAKKNGLAIEPLGNASNNLEMENYPQQVQEDFSDIIEDLEAPTPKGRLTIINGVPGSGKSYLIKGLVSATEKPLFVLIEPNKVSELTSPTGLKLIIDFKNGKASDELDDVFPMSGGKKNKSKPIVFIIEDADSCLASRTAGNMSDIHSLLNLCDGIVGTMLDIRVVATTNAEKPDLDEALMRPGRLSVHCEIGPLPFEQAQEVYSRIGGIGELENKPYTLAQLYGKAGGSKVKQKKNKVIGFGK